MNIARASFAESVPSWTSFGSQVEAYSDVDASVEGTNDRVRRLHLFEAIKQLPAIAADRGYRTVPASTLYLAVAFVNRLPTNRALPKVAVDEDGDVLMEWNTPAGRCSLTFEGRKLHMVANPGSKSTHVDPTIYNGGHIPPVLLANIPVRG